MIKVNSRIDQINSTHYGMWLRDISINPKGATRSLRRFFEQLGDTPNQIQFAFDLYVTSEPDYLSDALQKINSKHEEFQLQLVAFGEHLKNNHDDTEEGLENINDYITRSIPSYKCNVAFEQTVFRDTLGYIFNPVITVQFDQQAVLDAPYKDKQIFIEYINEIIWKFRHGIAFQIGRYIHEEESDIDYITRGSCKRKLEELKQSNPVLQDLEDEYLKYKIPKWNLFP